MKGNGSLVAEGDDGVDAECPARRKIAGSRDDGGEEKRRERMRRGMGPAYAVELIRDEAREQESARGPDEQARRGKTQALSHNQSCDIGGPRPERYAQANFLRAAADRIADDSIDADHGHEQRDGAEEADEREAELHGALRFREVSGKRAN